MTRRFWWAAAITVPILASMMSEVVPGRPLQLALPHGWQLPPFTYALYDLRFFWWPIVLLAVLQRLDPPLSFAGARDAFERSRIARLLLIP